MNFILAILLTGHNSSDHEFDEVNFDSLIFVADEFEEALSVGRIGAVFVESRRRHHARGIVNAAANRHLAAAEQLLRNRGRCLRVRACF